MKVFVTGGNGFIGSRVVRKLKSMGYQVRCLLRSGSKTARIDDLDFERHSGDLRDAKGLKAGMDGCDAVIHLAAISAWTDIRSGILEEIVVKGSENVYKAALEAGCPRCVYVSSVAAINGSRRPTVFDEDAPFELSATNLHYAKAKHSAEALAKVYCNRGLPVVIVNPVEVYGPEDTDMVTACNIRDILNSSPALSFKGGTSIAHVDDVADGIISAVRLGRPGERYILGGDNLSVDQIVRLTLSIAGKNTTVLKLPGRLLGVILKILARAGFATPVIPEVLDYATRFFFVDCAKARSELGYRPRGAREVLEPVIEWLKEKN